MPRHVVEAAEAMLDLRVPVHNKGGVALIEYMGSDRAIEEAARVSFIGSEDEVRLPAQTRGLIRYLMGNRHTTPLEMVELKFWVKAPMFVWRQWIRHRTASVNEISGRYVQLPDEWYLPEPQFINLQSDSNKQGRSEALVSTPDDHVRSFNAEAHGAYGAYENRLEAGMAKELARSNLPLSMYTEAIWKIDLHNLFHFLNLRLHPHAQWEIRAYAEVMRSIVKALVPVAWEAFEDFVLNAIHFSALEQMALREILKKGVVPADLGVFIDNFNAEELGDRMTGRERTGFAKKLEVLIGVETD